MLMLEHLFQPFGLDLIANAKRVKLARHMDSRWDLRRLYRDGGFDVYQAFQGSEVFKNADILVSFLGRLDRQAVFVGVYEIGQLSAPGTVSLPSDFPLQDMPVAAAYHYELRRDPRFDVLKDRLVIDWGPGTRSWVQNMRPLDKPVIEVLPEGYVAEFPGYLNVILSFDELVSIIKHPRANAEWHRMLAASAGVYLVLDIRTGKQYVGSASGEHGLLGRWRSYAENGHAGNMQLQALVSADHSSMRSLQFSILQTLDRALTRPEVIAFEALHKRKLGSRAHGLNSN